MCSLVISTFERFAVRDWNSPWWLNPTRPRQIWFCCSLSTGQQGEGFSTERDKGKRDPRNVTRYKDKLKVALSTADVIGERFVPPLISLC